MAGWADTQDATARFYLAGLPERAVFRHRLEALFDHEQLGAPEKRGGRYFSLRRAGLDKQATLVMREGLNGEDRILLDPNQWSEKGDLALAEWSVSETGTHVAFALQNSGSDWRKIRVLDVESGTFLKDEIGWAKDGSGFFYARFPEPEEDAGFEARVEGHAVYFHRLGTPQPQDRLLFRPSARHRRLKPAVHSRGNSMPEARTTRRSALILTLLTAALASAPPVLAQPKLGDALSGTVAALEKRTGGRLGVSVADLGSGASWSHRGAERFPIASTFKAFACAHLLDMSDKGAVDIGERVRFDTGDLESYSPVTEDHVGGEGMSLFEFCDAATAMSDNTAANFILKNTGGPEALTRFMRGLGDGTTRLDRYEPDLNDVGPGEVRDTTSPEAAAASLEKLVLGDALGETSRDQLETWLVANQVGGPLLRASLPDGWRIADRTGSGEYGSRAVIAVIWPKDGEASTKGPVVAAVYLTGTTLSLDERSAVIAEVGAAMVRDLAP